MTPHRSSDKHIGQSVVEKHHDKYRDTVEEFMGIGLVLNLFQGSTKNPVDERYIGVNCKLPILRHKLQRLFNRKIIDTIVNFDIHRELDDRVLQSTEIRTIWQKGIYAPAYRDVPLILQQCHHAHIRTYTNSQWIYMHTVIISATDL
jgi:hypothetical protein